MLANNMDAIDFNFNNIQLSFHLAKQKHLAWKFKFVDYLNGNTSMRHTQAVSHTHCDCGKWLYSEIIEQFRNMPEIMELEAEHKKIHDIAAVILEAQKSGDDMTVKEKYGKLVETSNNYLVLLEVTSNKLSSDIN
jgi:methyl-accepting chemotaxis protein